MLVLFCVLKTSCNTLEGNYQVLEHSTKLCQRQGHDNSPLILECDKKTRALIPLVERLQYFGNPLVNDI